MAKLMSTWEERIKCFQRMKQSLTKTRYLISIFIDSLVIKSYNSDNVDFPELNVFFQRSGFKFHRLCTYKSYLIIFKPKNNILNSVMEQIQHTQQQLRDVRLTLF